MTDEFGVARETLLYKEAIAQARLLSRHCECETRVVRSSYGDLDLWQVLLPTKLARAFYEYPDIASDLEMLGLDDAPEVLEKREVAFRAYMEPDPDWKDG